MKIDWKIIRNWALGEASEKEKQEVERWEKKTGIFSKILITIIVKKVW